MKTKMRLLRGALVLALGCFQAVPALAADNWPSRVITLTVPFGAGSGTDIQARIIAGKVSEILGEQVIIENQGGAGGSTAVARVAHAAPDGYRMIIGAVDTFAQSQYLFDPPPANTMTEFEPVALVTDQPLVLLARKTLPVNNLPEFIDYLKKNQEKMRFGSAGIGAAPYLACAMITRAVGAKATHVPYRSAAPALLDMVSGDIDYYCPLAVSAVPFVKNDSVKLLAVLTADRTSLFPDLKTAKEQGLDVTDGYYWNAFFMPKGTPPEIIKKMNAAISQALDDANVKSRLHELASTAVTPERRTPEYLKKYLADEIKKWAVIMKDNDVPQQKR
jgi:tripartite-type tricarboxylate transporter receptor subunit TctC